MARKKSPTLQNLVVGKNRKKADEEKVPLSTQKSDGSKSMKGQTLRLELDAWKQLRVLAAEQETTNRALIIEGLNLVFEKYNKPPIAK